MAAAQLNYPPDLVQTAFDAAPISIAVLRPLTNPDGALLDFEIVLVNDHALKLAGPGRGDLVGHSCTQVFPGVVSTGALDRLRSVAQSGEPASFECWCDHDGLHHWLHLSAVQHADFVVVTIDDAPAHNQAKQELLHAEQALQESQHLLESVFDASLAAVSIFKAITDEQDKLVDLEWMFANRRAQARAGSELIGRRASEFYPRAGSLPAHLHNVLKTGTPAEFEDSLMLDGELHWFHVLAQKYKDDCLMVTSVDVTDRKRAERNLLEAEQELARSATAKYVTLFRSIDEGFLLANVIFDNDNRPVDLFFLEANPAATRLLGRDYTGKRLQEISPDYDSAWYAACGRVADNGGGERVERQATPDQKWFSFYIFKAGEPASRRIAILVQEITQSKRAEEALRISEQRLQRVLETEAVGVIFFDQDGAMVHANDVFLHMTGYTRDQITRRELNWHNLTPPEWMPATDAQLQGFTHTGRIGPYEKEYIVADGSRRWMLFVGREIGDGTISEFCIDITEQKRTEAALRESEERFRLLVEGAHDYAMFLLDPDGRITYWSTGAERIFGWSEAEAIGRSAAIIFTHQDRALGDPRRELHTALTRGRAEDRRWHVRKDGSRLFLDGVLVRLDDEAGNLRGFVKIARDATEQHRSEEAIQRAHDELELRVLQRTADLEQVSTERQELLQRLVTAQEDERRRIARELHDTLGQFVSVLNLRLSILQQVAGDGPAFDAAIAQMRPVISQLDHELDRLAMELRPAALDDFGLPEAVRNYAEAWTHTANIPVDVYTTGLDDERLPPAIESTVYRIIQEALTNVVKHAKATAVSVVLERRRAALHLIVEDNGIGFDPDAAASHSDGRRSFGLLGMRERVTLAGGALQIETSPGVGTTLFVQIPLPTPAED